jgi:hypothetical protein
LRRVDRPHLLLVGAAGLHRALRVTAVFESLSEQIFLLSDLRQQYSELVADVAECLIVGALSPLAQLASDVSALLGRILVCADSMVLRLDQLVEALRELGLLGAAQRGEGEVRFAGGARRAVAFLRAGGVGAADVPASLLESSQVCCPCTTISQLATYRRHCLLT